MFALLGDVFKKGFMKNGFTLVELSIVLVIIGLLTGGILVAQSLIDSARSAKLTGAITVYESAINLFKSKFNQYPGDSSYFSPSGNFDNEINKIDGTGANCAPAPDDAYGNAEYQNVWAHLSQAKTLDKEYIRYSRIDCGGGHPNGFFTAELAGITAPYSDTSKTQTLESKSIISVYKNSAGTKTHLYLKVNPSDTYTLGSKMGVKDFDGSHRQTGLVVSPSVGVCAGEVNYIPTDVSCASDDADYGTLYYYLGD